MPEAFRQAVAELTSLQAREEITLDEVRPPKRLAPWAYALSAETSGPAGELATARLVLLYDPEGRESWGGELRLVAYLRAELDPELASDPLLPTVAWSWLTDALDSSGARWWALGGTVTTTSSARFGDIAGPAQSHDLELRGSWTPQTAQLRTHGEAFCALLASTAGLPPVGITTFAPRAASGSPEG